MSEQTIRQREQLKHYPVKDADYTSAVIVCFCCIAGCILGAVGILLNHIWPWITTEFYYIVNQVSAALN